MLSLRRAREFRLPPPIGASKSRELLAALRPPKRNRSLIAVPGINDATAATDYLSASTAEFVAMQLEYPNSHP